MLAAVYCRVSTSEQRDEGTSLDTQQERGLLKAAELGWVVPEDYIILEDWTGKDLERPGLLRLLELARSGGVQGVIIYTLDRLYRPENEGDEWRVFELLQRFQDAGVEVAWVDASIPTRGPLASVFTFLDSWRAGRERRAVLERTTRGRLEKARRGKVISRAAAPFGYRYDPQTSTLAVHEDEAKTVRLAFHLYIQERVSLAQLADRFNRLGIERPRGGLRWHRSNLGRMLRSETYAGTLWQNRCQTSKVAGRPGSRARVKFGLRPKAEQISTPVPAIVPRDVLEAARERIEGNLRLAPRNMRGQYLLTGLLKHTCGRSMGGRTKDGRTYYFCYRASKAGAPINDRGEPQPCSHNQISGRALEAAVWDKVTGLLRHPSILLRELKNLAGPGSLTREALKQEMAQVNRRLADLPKEETRLVEGYRKGFYDDAMMGKEIERVHQERAACEERQRELRAQIQRLERASTYAAQVKGLAARLSRGLDSMGFSQRRELLRLLVQEVVCDKGHVTVKTVLPLGRLRPTSPQI